MMNGRLTWTLGLVWAAVAVTPAFAAPDPWTIDGPFTAANVTGGPWTLGQTASPAHAATLADPRQGMCTGVNLSEHVGTDLMQPYYFPLTFGNDRKMTGYFDYRVKDNEELLAFGKSTDGGKSWQIRSTALQLNGGLCGTSGLTDNGQGHASVVTVNEVKYVYTLDRAASPSFLLVHTLAEGSNPLVGLPAQEPVSGNAIPGTASQVIGLQTPDGILGTVPGFHLDNGADDTVEVLYLSKEKDFYKKDDMGACPADSLNTALLTQLGKKPNQDLAVMRLAHTRDGINFTDDGPVSFDKINPADTSMAYTSTRFIGPRGTVVRYRDGSYGLFFSGGNCGDGDSDAYHYIGYAHSGDARNWVVDNDITNPLVSVDYANMGTTDPLRHHYSGRVYSPSVTFARNGKSATLIFSGYNTPQPLPSTKAGALLGVPTANYQPTANQLADYRAILNATLKRGTAPRPTTGDDDRRDD